MEREVTSIEDTQPARRDEEQDTRPRVGGAPLPADMRQRFESSLGTSLAEVRVHTDEGAATEARSYRAKAFTLGRDISFAAGQYDPGTTKGQRLLAHEVAHTVQQGGVASGPQLEAEVSQRGDPFEHEADHAAEAMLRGRPAVLGRVAVPIIARDEEGESHQPPDTAGDMAKAAETAQQDIKKDQTHVVTGNMDTVQDTEAAKGLIGKIDMNQNEWCRSRRWGPRSAPREPAMPTRRARRRSRTTSPRTTSAAPRCRCSAGSTR